jgi:plasmanylethanolamine desaturase
MIILKIVLLYLLADFISGLIHWWEDRYISSTTPFFGTFVGAPNERHHREPTHFLKQGYLVRIASSCVAAGILAAAFYMAGVRSWEAYFVLFILSQSNQIHAWAHSGKTKNGPMISYLQSLGVLQSSRVHARHHRAPYTANYCVLTNWVNPLLHKLGFWPKLERLSEKFLRVVPVK